MCVVGKPAKVSRMGKRTGIGYAETGRTHLRGEPSVLIKAGNGEWATGNSLQHERDNVALVNGGAA